VSQISAGRNLSSTWPFEVQCRQANALLTPSASCFRVCDTPFVSAFLLHGLDHTPLSTRAARKAERDDAESELEFLRTRVHDLQEENRHHADIISRDSLQNLSHLLSTAHRIQGEVASLISDVQALTDQAKRQKQLSAVPYTPVRSRTGSSASADAPIVHAPMPGTSPTNKEPATKAREFTWRDSQLTTMFRTSSDIKTIYNMSVSSPQIGCRVPSSALIDFLPSHYRL
jgi:hypothetical protein